MIRNTYIKNIAVALLLAVCTHGCRSNPKQLHLSNTDSFDRDNELVVLSRSLLEKKTGTIAKGKYLSIRTSDGKAITVQFDDLDADGKWDEAVFLFSLPASEKADLDLLITDAPDSLKAVALAHVRQMRKDSTGAFGPSLDKDSIPAGQPATDFTQQPLPPFLTEGPAWENDKVGFRIYFDVRNGKDVWGKTTSAMVLDEVGKDTAKNYHQKAAWGMDILKVGASLGAGSLALSVPLGDGHDTLVRLGGTNMGKVYYEKIADGPVRAILRLRYPNWKISDSLPPVSVTDEISIWGGQYFYQDRVTISNAPKSSRVVTGIVNLHSKESWQQDTAGCRILYTYDAQSENGDNLGMAIITPAAAFPSLSATPNDSADIQHTYTVLANVKKSEPFEFRFYACWEASDPRFNSLPGFSNYLQNEGFLYGGKMKVE